MLMSYRTLTGVAGFVLCLGGPAVCAGDPDTPAQPDAATLPFATAVVAPAELDAQRGREGLDVDEIFMQLNDVHANASIGNNALTSQQTGGNTVEAGAFSNASGLVFNVQNSGNHVIIQNTTLINVNMQP